MEFEVHPATILSQFVKDLINHNYENSCFRQYE